MDMDQVGHFVRQRRVFIGISVLLAAVYFFCLDLKTLAIFSVDTKIEDPAWVNGILISLWAYYLYRFRVARFKLGEDWRVKAPMLEQAGRFAQKYAAPSLARKENIGKAREIIVLPPAPDNWNIELNLASLLGGPESTRFTAGRIYQKANVHWNATSLSGKTSGTTSIELAYSRIGTWKSYALTAKEFLFKDVRLGEYYLPTLIGFAWLAIYLLEIKYTADGISIGCGCW